VSCELEELLNTGDNWFDKRQLFLLASIRMDWSMLSL
jgi:hypothetical protein